MAIIYLVEILKYQIGYFALFSKHLLKRWIFLAVGIPFFIAAFLNYLGENGIYILMYLCVVIGMFLTMQEKLSVRVMRLSATCFVLLCMDEFWGDFLPFYDSEPESGTYLEDFQYLSASLITGGILLVVLFIKSRLRKEHYEKLLSLARKGMQPLVAVMAVTMLFTISALSYAKKYIANERFHTVVNWVSTISLLGIGMLGIVAIYIRNVNQKMEMMMRRELELQDMQKRYYETLLEKEEDTRKYRHDMDNHLICLNAIAEDGDIRRLKAYLLEMKGKIELIQNKCYVTGNKMMDVIFNYYISLLDVDVAVSVEGRFHAALSIDEMELCTIYANLMQNAVEEIGRQEKGCGRFLKILITQGKTYFETEIRNSVSDDTQKEEISRIKKKDKRNHGLGLKNVERVIKEHEGCLEVKKERFCFCVKVVLRNAEITV